MITMSILKTINKNIKMIAATGAKLDKLVHETGCLCIGHAANTGDIRPMENLFKALNKGYRAKGFSVWMGKYSPIRLTADGKFKLLSPENKGFVAFDVDGANQNPFWTLEEANEKTVKELSIETLRALVSRFASYVEEADAEGKVYNKDGVLVKEVKGDIVQLREYAGRAKIAVAA